MPAELPFPVHASPGPARQQSAADLPRGAAPAALEFPHFPSRLHAFVWRNWELVPLERIARVVQAQPAQIRSLARAMGLPAKPKIRPEQLRRSSLTIIKRNWHLLPYDQLLDLLSWTPEEMAFSLREDDFLFVKLGNLKPQCAPLLFTPADELTTQREAKLRDLLRQEFPGGLGLSQDALFSFVEDLASPPRTRSELAKTAPSQPRYCYSYFALYGDPLLDTALDPYPDGYLARLADSGVNGVWLQALLMKLAPFPWDAARSNHFDTRLRNLRALVKRDRRHGIGIYLYLNEPRAMPVSFFASHPELKGVTEGDYAVLCTTHQEVKDYLRQAVANLCRAVPDIAGLFTITASENLTTCWSHHNGQACPRCGKRPPAEVIAEVNRTIGEGIHQARASTQLIAWDWGWRDEWASDIIRLLPTDVALMSVSEWSLPIERGGIKSTVGEYSISAVGPGPRATRHWQLARQRGMRVFAKVQVGNTWELSAVPYVPAVENVTRHAANLRDQKIDGMMLGWTLGGYPSPNLEAVAEIASKNGLSPTEAMQNVASSRFGKSLAPLVVAAWRRFSSAFNEYPFGSGLYFAPLQLGPANLLWLSPTGYAATMVGFGYDDLNAWRGNYPAEIFAEQLAKVASGFEEAIRDLRSASDTVSASKSEHRALERELSVAEAAAIHFRSVSLQCQFVLARQDITQAKPGSDPEAQKPQKEKQDLRKILAEEIELARRLRVLQLRDSRLGFEASNQYYYVPLDLAEKVLNCRALLERLG